MGTNHRVGLVGAGYVSTYHIRALQTLNNVEIVGITDLDQSKAQEVASKFQIPFAKDTKELYAAGATVVHVLTPPSSHCSVALDALRHGCHVFIEKPMAVTQEECDRIIKTATVEQRTVSVNHSMKFDPAVRKALALIEKNAIGDVVGVEYLRSSEYPAYQGGGDTHALPGRRLSFPGSGCARAVPVGSFPWRDSAD